MFSLVFAMSLTAWVGTARMVRGQILQIKEQDYVQAATALGASTGRIIIKHLDFRIHLELLWLILRCQFRDLFSVRLS